MLAEFWYVDSFDDFGLWGVRLTAVVANFLILYLYLVSFPRRPMWAQVRTPVKIFAIGWVFLLAYISSALYFANHAPFGEWFRQVYGAAFVGALLGVFWCVSELLRACAPCYRRKGRASGLVEREHGDE